MITSVQNNQVKEWKKLHRKKFRTETGTFLIEGYHLIEEAYESDWHISMVIMEEGKDAPEWMAADRVSYVASHVFKEISQTEAPQGIAAVVQMKEMDVVSGNDVLLVDAVQDPGNLGTLIRTADAAGFSRIVLGKGTVDMYNDKVIRATQGSLFHIPVVQADLTEEIPSLQADGYDVWASSLNRAVNYVDVEVKDKTALVVGNEGAGIQGAVLDMANTLVKIPIYGKAESLNVSIAAAILMYHVKS